MIFCKKEYYVFVFYIFIFYIWIILLYTTWFFSCTFSPWGALFFGFGKDIFEIKKEVSKEILRFYKYFWNTPWLWENCTKKSQNSKKELKTSKEPELWLVTIKDFGKCFSLSKRAWKGNKKSNNYQIRKRGLCSLLLSFYKIPFISFHKKVWWYQNLSETCFFVYFPVL